MGFCENNSALRGPPRRGVKLIKCARIYESGAEMKRINRRAKMDGCWKMMTPRPGLCSNCFRGQLLGDDWGGR